jgi:pimeloyl-ACP methyl ester carboxylesterase/predicted small secreted protein
VTAPVGSVTFVPLATVRRPVVRSAAAAALCFLLAACTQTVAGQGRRASGSQAPGSSAAGGPQSPGASQKPITFTDCSSVLNASAIPVPSALQGKITFGCARLNVPLDYANQSGPTIALELVKVHDKDNKAGVGSLLVNPGGPGGSGVELALGLLQQMSPDVLRSFDLIGFDPRGVGLSTPISCISDAEKDRLNAASPDVLTATGFQQAKDLAKTVADACSTKYGANLQFFDTVNTAKDMDLIRQAVGDDRMNYLGFSYGTELGSVYAHLFPDKVRVAVLDGAVDPLTDDITSFADQLGGFEAAFDQFAADCLTRTPCKSLGDPRQSVYAVVKAATAAPLPTGTSRNLTSSLALTGVLEALYSRSDWPTLGDALISAGKGDGKGLLDLADQYNQRQSDGTYSNIMDANTTINCNDSKPGPTDATVSSTATAWATKFPMFGKWAAISLFSCQQWQPDRTPPPLPSAATPTKVLVIGNLHDPATPYQGAKDLAKTMGNAELLTWDGEGHTSYLEGSTCVDGYVNAYLISQKLPPDSTTCPR